jgi:hypothetical protein
MQLDGETRRDFQTAADRIRSYANTLVRSISEDAWPLAEDVAVSLVEQTLRLHKAVSDVLSTTRDADVDVTQLKEATVSLRRFIPELNAANLTAAVDYMAAKGGRGAEDEAYSITHQNRNQVTYLAGHLSWIEKGLGLKSSEPSKGRS